ncbi:MAG: HXXEE domain-containing protein [Chthoniobacterales bacterium]|nr:HXXEE domain-containing protein [Chthoniobacterales bacterium]
MDSSGLRWLLREWPYAALFTAGFLLALAPFFGELGLPLLLVYLQLPLYMVHQFEEHRQDRFRKFFNEVLGGGREALTPGAVFVINSVGVWGVDLASLYLAWSVGLGWGLVAVYLTLVNAVVHIVMSVALRRYNPGLWTAVFVFLPAGLWALVVVSAASGASWHAHGLAAGAVVLLHVLIMVWARMRLFRFRRRGAT